MRGLAFILLPILALFTIREIEGRQPRMMIDGAMVAQDDFCDMYVRRAPSSPSRVRGREPVNKTQPDHRVLA